MQKLLLDTAKQVEGATVFGHKVENPERYGVVELDDRGHVLSIEEKPEQPRSCYAVTGLYFYDGRAVTFAKQVQPSARGEFEITDLNRMYAEQGTLQVKLLPHGYAWMDMGTCETLFASASFVRQILKRQGINVGCLEEVALNNGWITREDVKRACSDYVSSTYGSYITNLLSSYFLSFSLFFWCFLCFFFACFFFACFPLALKNKNKKNKFTSALLKTTAGLISPLSLARTATHSSSIETGTHMS